MIRSFVIAIALSFGVGWAVWLNVSQPLGDASWATASRQPATHEPSPTVLALTGGYQAQGRGPHG